VKQKCFLLDRDVRQNPLEVCLQEPRQSVHRQQEANVSVGWSLNERWKLPYYFEIKTPNDLISAPLLKIDFHEKKNWKLIRMEQICFSGATCSAKI